MSNSSADIKDDDALKRSVVELTHPLFVKLEGVRFHLHQTTGQPGMTVMMGKNEAFLTLTSVRKEFQIDPISADGHMLTQIANALKYVKGLLIGDSLPSEILTGEAHWKITPRQLQIAHQRVAVKLITLVTADEPTTSDPVELLKMADDPVIKKQINEAFEVAAVELGLERTQKQLVIDKVNVLAEELGYIEALREKFGLIDKMREKIQLVRKIHSGKPAMWTSSDQVARLIERAKLQYIKIFDEIDARTADIIPMLRGLEETIALVRKMRDDLYIRLMAWDSLLLQWNQPHVEHSFKMNDMLLEAHQFLAPRFMSFTDWTALAREEQSKRSKLKIQPMSW